jgi:hypothetical protein
MCSFAAIFAFESAEKNVWYFSKARQLVPSFVEHPTIEAVQAMLILALTGACK